MRVVTTLMVATAVLVLPATLAAGERAKAMVDCKEADKQLAYDCTIMLMGKDSGKPIEGADLVVKADMPTMPMAHNVKPVKAMPMGKPGSYMARLELEMQGEWALTMDVSGPMRDRLIEKVQFGAISAEGGMKHGDMKPGESMDKMKMKPEAEGEMKMKPGDHGDMMKKQE